MIRRSDASRAGKVVLQVLFLWLIFLAGEWVVARLHLPLPGSVFGMLLLLTLLSLGAVKERWVQEGAGLLTKHLAFFFIPIAVGLMQWWPLFRREGHWLLVTLVISTLAAMIATATVVHLLGSPARREEDAQWSTSSSLRSPSP